MQHGKTDKDREEFFCSSSLKLVTFETMPGKFIQAGAFETPTVAELRNKALEHKAFWPKDVKCEIENAVGESGALHFDKDFEGAVFQAASQFNCLEFPSPHNTPEEGITQYMYDRTQGPACAIACPAGTAFRNYLHPLNGKIGQQRDNQINTLADVTAFLTDDQPLKYYEVKNGYIDTTNEKLQELNAKLSNKEVYSAAKDKLRIGVQWETEVVGSDPVQYVTQTYNSACSVGYSANTEPKFWAPFATMVLEASYEATFWVAVIENSLRAKKGLATRPVLLTKVGGGVFGNDQVWIKKAIKDGMETVRGAGASLTARIVHFRSIEPGYEDFKL
eukprot:PhF_6_TR26284/c1_g1_i2/m.37662